jgi:formate/nitrite transporter FocA (FNT family)
VNLQPAATLQVGTIGCRWPTGEWSQEIGVTDAGADSPHLERRERRQAATNAPLTARVIHEIVREDGENEIERDAASLIWSGLAAGLSIGFSFYVQALLQSSLPDAPWSHLISSFGYTIGFVIVVLGRQQLFTESTLTAVLPVLTRRKADSAWKCLRLWALVLAANILGAWLFAAALAYGRPFQADVAPTLEKLAAEAATGAFGWTVLRAVFSGWLIALMVWLLPSAGSARLFVILLITYVVALARLPHVIAGSAEVAYGVLTHKLAAVDYALRFFAPTLIGNTVGGVLFVALLNHAPVSPELKNDSGGEQA